MNGYKNKTDESKLLTFYLEMWKLTFIFYNFFFLTNLNTSIYHRLAGMLYLPRAFIFRSYSSIYCVYKLFPFEKEDCVRVHLPYIIGQDLKDYYLQFV